MPKGHRLGAVSNRHLSPSSPGGRISDIQVRAGLVPPEASLPGVATAACSLRPHVVFLVCVCVLTSSSHKDPGPFGVCFVQLVISVTLIVTPWTAAHQASLSFTISQSLLKFMAIA